MSIRENINHLKSEIPVNVSIIAISKTKTREQILEAYETGHRLFGENRVQELAEKASKLPGEIQWHMVGHLQSNKVKYIVPFVSMIQSVDSLKLLSVINNESLKINKIQDCLLQVYIAREETKFGFSETELESILSSGEFEHFHNVRIAGLMGIATFTNDESVVKKEFRNLADIFKKVKKDFFSDRDYFRELSMGMSGDYRIAIEEGSTMVRIGTLIFGERPF